VLDEGIRTRKEESFVAVVTPPDAVGRTAVVTMHLEDLCVPIGLTHVMTLDDQSVTDLRLHDPAPPCRLAVASTVRETQLVQQSRSSHVDPLFGVTSSVTLRRVLPFDNFGLCKRGSQ
jgi:hypothetical protein